MNAVIKPQSPFARILEVTQDEYFADPCEIPSLSQSLAHTLITETPLHAWNTHPRFGAQRGASTKATDDGQLIHKLLLGKGTVIDLIAANDFRTKAAQEARDASIAKGRLPILEYRFAEAQATAEILKGKLLELGIELNGMSEVAIEWDEPGEFGPVRCRCMMDHVFFDRGKIYDIKKIRSAHPKTCGKHAVEYGYDIQHTAYTNAFTALHPEFAGRVDFVFLFLELDAPHVITPARLDGTLRELGDQRWNRAVTTWERCLRKNHWPAYVNSIVSIEAPPWAITQEMGDQYANW
jgi:hypothetical protein